MTARLPEASLRQYDRFSLFNSPYAAHDHGCAVDLYPGSDRARSPVAGVVSETRTVTCPTQEYAVGQDHLIVIDLDPEWAQTAGLDPTSAPLARVLHVDPTVAPGDRIAVGDSLGGLIRSGFFGRWVDNHIHLGFRPGDSNAVRATGSVPLQVDTEVLPMKWDGTGTVVETGPAHALLDAPTHPSPGTRYAAIADDEGTPLDGGLAHYPAGGLFGDREGSLSLLGTRVGRVDGRDVRWDAIDILANGSRVTGLSLFAARDAEYGAKLVSPGHEFTVGESVEIRIRPSENPIRLGTGH